MQTFNLVSPFEPVQRRAFELDDTAILRATNAAPLVGGEFLHFTATTYKMARGTMGSPTPGTPANERTVPSYAFFGEPGRSDMQALGKGTFLFLNPYEADTKIFDVGTLAVGEPLSVWSVDIGDGIARCGLAEKSAGWIVGYVTRLPINNNGWLRFHTA
jgi:hypothetical protein